MTPEQKIKSAILAIVARWNNQAPAVLSAANVDAIYADADEDHVQDAKEEFRNTGTRTGLPCEYLRNYESESVATKMPDGSWVGWPHFFGGGKHSEPSAIAWMDKAYTVDCVESKKVVTVRTFTKTGAAA